MGYVQVGEMCVKKDSVKAWANSPEPYKILVDFASLLLLDNEEVKNRHLAVEQNLETFHDAVERYFIYRKTLTLISVGCT